jgi:hypothetical protein
MYSRVVCVQPVGLAVAQLAKTTFFASGDEAGVRQTRRSAFGRPKVDPTGAGQDGEAQKAPQATFSNERGAAWYGNTVDGIGG